MILNRTFLAFLVLFNINFVNAQVIFKNSQVMTNAFPLLTAMQTHSEIHQLISNSEKLKEIAEIQTQKIFEVRKGCEPLPRCIVDAVLLDENAITQIHKELRGIKNPKRILELATNTELTQGALNLYRSLPEEDQMGQAWVDSAKALNKTIRTYALSEKPLYPDIDASVWEPNSRLSTALLLDLISQPEFSKDNLFFSTSYKFVEYLLYLQDRENAGSYANLDINENLNAFKHLREIDWSSFPYASILVLGDGPTEYGMKVGFFGKLRLAEAVRLFKEGKAPVIIVSGGNVHPARTPFNEAVEMKNELVKRYGINEKSILIEPFARHTTTNFRNAARLMNRYNFPPEKTSLVTSSKFHIDYCLSEIFSKRQMDELGYLAIGWGKRISNTALEFVPSNLSLHKNSIDPLDP